jgi:hypothetical protein
MLLRNKEGTHHGTFISECLPHRTVFVQLHLDAVHHSNLETPLIPITASTAKEPHHRSLHAFPATIRVTEAADRTSPIFFSNRVEISSSEALSQMSTFQIFHDNGAVHTEDCVLHRIGTLPGQVYVSYIAPSFWACANSFEGKGGDSLSAVNRPSHAFTLFSHSKRHYTTNGGTSAY